jgi:uracil-DNA glycosylase
MNKFFISPKIYEYNSHKNFGWEQFTDAVSELINIKCKSVVFILCGADTKREGYKIDTQKYFSRCNNYLISKNKTPINWQI